LPEAAARQLDRGVGPLHRQVVGHVGSGGVVGGALADLGGALGGQQAGDDLAAEVVGRVVLGVAEAEDREVDTGEVWLHGLHRLGEGLGRGRQLAVAVGRADDEVEVVGREVAGGEVREVGAGDLVVALDVGGDVFGQHLGVAGLGSVEDGDVHLAISSL
jgi:hypothetical protein